MTNAPSGWQPDPSGRHELRYWDGTTWTEQVADGGVSSADPIGPSGEQPAVAPGASGSGELVPPGGQPWTAPGGPSSGGQIPSHPGGMGPTQPPGQTGPSTGVLVGLGIVVLGLAVAIGVLLLSDDGGDDEDDVQTTSETETPDDTTEPDTTESDTSDTTEAVDEMEEEELEEAAPSGMSTQIDTMVADFQGEITEEDARCMMREAGAEGIRRDIDASQSFDSLPVEDRSAIMFAMLDTCVDASQVMANLIATGMVGTGEVNETQAQCAADALVESIGVQTLIDAIAANETDPINELSEDDQIAAQNAVIDCM